MPSVHAQATFFSNVDCEPVSIPAQPKLPVRQGEATTQTSKIGYRHMRIQAIAQDSVEVQTDEGPSCNLVPMAMKTQAGASSNWLVNPDEAAPGLGEFLKGVSRDLFAELNDHLEGNTVFNRY